MAARYLGKKVIPTIDYPDPEVPPISRIEGVDLVTEGVVTISKGAQDRPGLPGGAQPGWGLAHQEDGASLIAQALIERATDINFFVGKAINPAPQNPDLPITFGIKIQLIDSLAGAWKSWASGLRSRTSDKGEKNGMRIFDTDVQKLKYQILREVARCAYEDRLATGVLDIPLMIAPGPKPTMRCCVYKERAITAERVKLAMGGRQERRPGHQGDPHRLRRVPGEHL